MSRARLTRQSHGRLEQPGRPERQCALPRKHLGHLAIDVVLCHDVKIWAKWGSRNNVTGMGSKKRSKPLNPRHYPDDWNDPMRTDLLMWSLALFRAKDWALLLGFRLREFPRESAELKDIGKFQASLSEKPFLGSRKAHDVLKAWVPDLVAHFCAPSDSAETTGAKASSTPQASRSATSAPVGRRGAWTPLSARYARRRKAPDLRLSANALASTSTTVRLHVGGLARRAPQCCLRPYPTCAIRLGPFIGAQRLSQGARATLSARSAHSAQGA